MAENPPRELAGLWKRRLPRRQELGGLLETEEGWVPGQNGKGREKPFTWTLGGRLQRMQVKSIWLTFWLAVLKGNSSSLRNSSHPAILESSWWQLRQGELAAVSVRWPHPITWWCGSCVLGSPLGEIRENERLAFHMLIHDEEGKPYCGVGLAHKDIR